MIHQGKLHISNIPVYEAKPEKPWGAILLIQEIFGVNAHIQSIADRYAQEGLHVWAPSYFFEPAGSDVVLEYDPKSFVRGRQYAADLGWPRAVELTQSFANQLQARSGLRVGVVGFCWGGSLAWLAACRVEGLSGAVAYYGRAIPEYRNEIARCPFIAHFGKQDSMIPIENVTEFQRAQPSVSVYVYDAGHGFNRDAVGHMDDFNPEASRLAKDRTLSFLRERLL